MEILHGTAWEIQALGALVLGGLVIALFFLKAAPKERILPSIMLWRRAVLQHDQRRLGRCLRHLFHLLFLLLAIALLTAALLGLNVRGKNDQKTTVVAEPTALQEAVRLYRRLPANQRELIVCKALPQIADVTVLGEEKDSHAVVNRSAAIWLAAQQGGQILYCGPSAPPWLPPQGRWIKCGQVPSPPPEPKVSLYAPGIPSSGAWKAVVHPAEADLILQAKPEKGELLDLVKALKGEAVDGLQHQQLRAEFPGERGRLVLEDWLWLAGLVMVLADMIFWLLRKAI